MRQARSSSEIRKHRQAKKAATLDAQRAASMADEGGASAAMVENDDPKERTALRPEVAKRRGPAAWLVGGLIGVAALGALGWLRRA